MVHNNLDHGWVGLGIKVFRICVVAAQSLHQVQQVTQFICRARLALRRIVEFNFLLWLRLGNRLLLLYLRSGWLKLWYWKVFRICLLLWILRLFGVIFVVLDLVCEGSWCWWLYVLVTALRAWLYGPLLAIVFVLQIITLSNAFVHLGWLFVFFDLFRGSFLVNWDFFQIIKVVIARIESLTRFLSLRLVFGRLDLFGPFYRNLSFWLMALTSYALLGVLLNIIFAFH